MAMARVCDACGELVEAPFKPLKVLDAAEEGMEPRNFKTVRSMDLHGNCYDDLVDYLDGVKREARKVRAIATIADEGVPANGGPGR